MASGSMDSYVSHGPGTDATSVSDETEDNRYHDIAGDTVMSPRSMSRASTERQSSDKFGKVTRLDTDIDRKLAEVKKQEEDDDHDERDVEKDKASKEDRSQRGEEDEVEEPVVMVDSPISSEDEMQKTPIRGVSR
ncbi:uncharacterized protein L201_002484 [Kwoniella dendrophila CBS 6074]|uniref:Uncharacterized protein n=1 Tax=Kwoniella dendrophila CBS 6074 TaxID=1295534 RepID=A0AAX4JS60_9TREE